MSRAGPAFDLQPTLRGRLVALRPLREEDFPALFAVASDPLIWEQHPDKDRCTEPVFRRFFEGAMASRGALLATDAADGHVIGTSRYHDWVPERSEVEIGWTFLARSHWGGRCNGEMKRLMLEHAFRFVDTVVFTVHESNWRSQRALEKIGAVRTRSGPDRIGRPSVFFRISAEAFRRGPLAGS